MRPTALLLQLILLWLSFSLGSAHATPPSPPPGPWIGVKAPSEQAGKDPGDFDFDIELTHFIEYTEVKITFEVIDSINPNKEAGIFIPPVRVNSAGPTARVNVKPRFFKEGWYKVKMKITTNKLNRDDEIEFIYVDGKVFYGRSYELMPSIINHTLTSHEEYQMIVGRGLKERGRRENAIRADPSILFKDEQINNLLESSIEVFLNEADREKYHQIRQAEHDRVFDHILKKLGVREDRPGDGSIERDEREKIIPKMSWPANELMGQYAPLTGRKTGAPHQLGSSVSSGCCGASDGASKKPVGPMDDQIIEAILSTGGSYALIENASAQPAWVDLMEEISNTDPLMRTKVNLPLSIRLFSQAQNTGKPEPTYVFTARQSGPITVIVDSKGHFVPRLTVDGVPGQTRAGQNQYVREFNAVAGKSYRIKLNEDAAASGLYSIVLRPGKANRMAP